MLRTVLRDRRGTQVDLPEAARLWRQAADKGNALAEAGLAYAFMYGKGVERDYDAALRLARRAADKGNAFGELHMGTLYACGWGVPQDKREASRWWAKSAAQGNEAASAEREALLLVSASVGYTFANPAWEASLECTNCGDEKYFPFGSAQADPLRYMLRLRFRP